MLQSVEAQARPEGPIPAEARWAAPPRSTVAAQILAGVALIGALHVHLLSSLLAGLLVYELVHGLARSRVGAVVHRQTAKILVVALLAAFVIAAVTAAIFGLIAVLTKGSDNLAVLLQKMAEVIETIRARLPAWALDSLPDEPTDLREMAVSWLREHAGLVRSFGQNVSRGLLHIVFGMVIGGMIAVSREAAEHEHGPLARALVGRARHLGAAFRSVVFAQIRISALNTALTALYLVVVLPAMGIHLPFAKTMIAVTFLTGLLPVIGNLISNAVIVIVSLTVSPTLAVASLAFLIVIHKLEYFVNARVMGGQIHARAWELLTAMLVMDAIFGVPGLVAAPIYYAYLKNELASQKLI